LAAILLMGLVIFWYVQDETTRGGQAKSGFLAMSDKPETKKRRDEKESWKRTGKTHPWRVTRR
jgi:hypothetical protein